MGETPIPPSIIGGHFCKTYYAAFNKERQELYKMYAETSCYTFGLEGNVRGDEIYYGREVFSNVFLIYNYYFNLNIQFFSLCF